MLIFHFYDWFEMEWLLAKKKILKQSFVLIFYVSYDNFINLSHLSLGVNNMTTRNKQIKWQKEQLFSSMKMNKKNK
jgi:hypothetical protein